MKLNKLRLTNFKRHKNLEVDFPDGCTLIVGPNYRGKSSILHGILVGLLGNRAIPGDVKEMVSDGARNFKVELWLSNGYHITRTASDSRIEDGSGSLVVNSHSAVNKHLEDLFGLDRQGFGRLHVCKQGEPQQLLDMDGTQLHRFVESCVGADRLDEVVKLARTHGSQLEIQCETLERFIADPDTLKEWETGIAELTEAMRVNKGQQSDQETEVADAKLLVDGWDTKLVEASAQQEKWVVYRDQQDRAKLRLEESKNALKNCQPFKDLSELVSKVDETHELLTKEESTRTKYLQIQRTVERCRDRYNVQQEAVNSHKRKMEEGGTSEYPKTLQTWNEDLKQAMQARSEADAKLQDLYTQRQAVDKLILRGVCPQCERPFDDVKENLPKWEEKSTSLMQLYEDEKVVLKAAGDSVRDLTARIKKKESDTQDLRLKEDRLDIFSKDLQQALKEEDDCDLPLDPKELKDLQNTLARAKDEYREAENNNARVSSINKTIAEQKQLLEAPDVPQPETDPGTLRGELKELRLSLSTKEETLRSYVRHHTEMTVRHSELTSKISEHDRVYAEYQGKITVAKRYKNIAKIVADNRVRLMETAWNNIISLTSDFVKTVTGGDMAGIIMSETGIKFEENGVLRSPTQASGAQKTLIGVGLKIALSQVASSSFDCMLLDEISADMDPVISAACLTTLVSLRPQTVVVSHRTMDVADHIISL